MLKLRKYLYLLTVIPLIIAVGAVFSHNIYLREGVAFACALICVMVVITVRKSNRLLWILAEAFLLSIIGDMFLNHRAGEVDFVLGIFFFFFAHVCFFSYALSIGKFSWPIFIVIAVPCLVFYFAALLPSPGLEGNNVLAVAALAFLLISCFSFAAAISGIVRNPGQPARWFFAAGIVSLLISNTFIAFNDFIQYRGLDFLIMPFYYLAHILIVLSVTADYTIHSNKNIIEEVV